MYAPQWYSMCASVYMILAWYFQNSTCSSGSILFYFTFKIFLRSAKKAELEENQRSYKQKKKRRRIKVQEDSSSENKVIIAFIVCLNYYSPIILYFIINSPFLFVFHSVITFYYLNFTIVERIICSFLFSTFSKKVFNSFLICYFIHI